MDFSVNFCSVCNDTFVYNSILCNILWRNIRTVRIDLPEFFIKIKLRNDVDQFHIRFPIRAECSNIFPVSVVLICKQPVPFFMTIWNNVFSEITVWLVFQLDKCLFKNRPAEDIDSHRCQITAWLLRLLFEFFDPAVLICHYNSETACFFHRHRHCCNCHISIVCLMEIKHHFIIHLINMIS